MRGAGGIRLASIVRAALSQNEVVSHDRFLVELRIFLQNMLRNSPEYLRLCLVGDPAKLPTKFPTPKCPHKVKKKSPINWKWIGGG